VLISDYRMPRLDGVTLLARARELDPRAVRMMLSAAADFDTVLAAVNRAGVFRYIPKPWSEPQLLADLHAALVFDPCAMPSAYELERRRLEALEPGITHVEWGPNGEVLMPGYLPTRPGE
jgi:two-component system, probable response regulator PhcQ